MGKTSITKEGTMAKTKTLYTCQECGSQYPKWQGQCRDCGQWNSLVEETLEPSPKNLRTGQSRGWVQTESSQVQTLRLNENAQNSNNTDLRIRTHLQEWDRVTGGGLVKGSYLLLGGDPGVGKSTLLLQVCGQLGKKEVQALYISGEESPQQTLLRAHRLDIKTANVTVASENRIEVIRDLCAKHKPGLLIVDSIQTIYSSELQSAPGTVSQVRECASELLDLAKSTGTVVILVGHVTKEGGLAGPKVLEHMVDTVLSFEGEASQQFRILRALKNRFGPTNEIGVFQMNSMGLEEVKNPSELFLEERDKQAIGSSVFGAMEGTRPLLCEIQSLVNTSYFPNPRRHCVGIEINRVHLILAVLNRFLGLDFSQKDVFINVVGGLKLSEPAVDLAIAASLFSSQKNIYLPLKTCFIGEVGLTGEVRGVTQIYERVSEALKLGFTDFYLPYSNLKTLKKHDLKDAKIRGLKNIDQLKAALTEGAKNLKTQAPTL